MRRFLMKISIAKYLIVICFALLLFPVSVEAQNFERMSEYEQNLYGESAYVNGDYETMKHIRSYWVKECNQLKNRNYEFVLCGNAEAVLKVTIPSRLLFVSGEATLSSQADAIIRPLLKFVGGKDAYAKCIISCHSDNNGSEKYLAGLTKKRADSIRSWMMKQGVSNSNMSSYGLANLVPRTKNENVRNRERNRRLTIYLVPTKKMLKAAKKGII